MTYCFGKFSLDKKSRKLLFDRAQVAVNQRGIDILIHLIEQNGATASKEDILAAVWPDQYVLPSNLVKQISLLRRALEELSPDSAIILTIPGIGYRVEQWAVAPPTISGERDDLSAETVSDGRVIPTTTSEQQNPNLVSFLTRLPFHSITRLQKIIVLVTLSLLCAFCFLIFITLYEVKWFRPGPSKVLLARTNSGFKRSLKYSHDGKLLAYFKSEEPDGPGEFFILNIGQDKAARLPVEEKSDDQFAWSPDGERVALLRASDVEKSTRQLVISSIDGRSTETIAQVKRGGLDWAPDGKNFAVCDLPSESSKTASLSCPSCTVISLLSVDGKIRSALTVPVTNGRATDSMPRFSPDGSKVAFIRRNEDNTADIFVVGLTDSQPRRLTFDKREISDLNWSEDGREILFISNRSGKSRLWRVSTAEMVSPSLPLLVEVINSDIRNFTLSSSGGLAYVTQPSYTTEINLTPLPGSLISSILPRFTGLNQVPCSINSNDYSHSPRFSPDGKRVTFISNRSGYDEIWVANSNCSNQRQVSLLNQKGTRHPDWSPDGTRIAFNQIVDGQYEIFDIEVEGGRIRRLTNSPYNDTLPKWSSNGKAIYFCSMRDPNNEHECQVWKLSLDGGEISNVTNNNYGEYIESADGSSLYFTRDARIWRKDIRLEGEEPVSALQEFPVGNYWDLTSDHSIYLVSSKRGEERILHRFNLNSSRIERVTDLGATLPQSVPGLDVSPNGKIVAFTSITSPGQDIRLVKSFR